MDENSLKWWDALTITKDTNIYDLLPRRQLSASTTASHSSIQLFRTAFYSLLISIPRADFPISKMQFFSILSTAALFAAVSAVAVPTEQVFSFSEQSQKITL